MAGRHEVHERRRETGEEPPDSRQEDFIKPQRLEHSVSLESRLPLPWENLTAFGDGSAEGKAKRGGVYPQLRRDDDDEPDRKRTWKEWVAGWPRWVKLMVAYEIIWAVFGGLSWLLVKVLFG